MDALGSRFRLSVPQVWFIVSVHSKLLLRQLLLGHVEPLVRHAAVVGARPQILGEVILDDLRAAVDLLGDPLVAVLGSSAGVVVPKVEA